MSRIDRDKQRARMKKQIDDIIRNNPEYARRHKEEQEDPDYFKALAAELKKEIGIDFIEFLKEGVQGDYSSQAK